MFSRSIASYLLILIVVLASTVSGQTARNVSITAFRGDNLVLDFRRFFRRPGKLITITQLPIHGTLFLADAKTQVKVGDSSDSNSFVYKSNEDFPEEGVAKGVDFVKFDLETQGRKDSAFVNIIVRLRSVTVKNYTLVSVDAKKPRQLKLNVRDGTRLLSLKDPVLGKVQIETLPTNGCKVTQFDNTEITTEKTAVTDVQLRVKVIPRPDMQGGESCYFGFSAVRRNGIRTPTAYVTLNQQSSLFAPRAYNTTSIYNVQNDASRFFEMIGQTRNPGANLTFVLTSLPSVGQVYDVAETGNDNLPDVGINVSLPVNIYTGPKTRVVFVYRVNPKDVKPPTRVTVGYYVKDSYGRRSDPATVTIRLVSMDRSPVCGQVIVTPVFWDKPVKEIALNYTNPNGRVFQKLILLKGPSKPLGDLYFSRPTIAGENRKPLKAGDYFTDRDKRLSYMVRRDQMRNSGNDTFLFRAQTLSGMSCVGNITFVVMQHDARVHPAGINIRREVVRVDSLNLLPLWGTANRSIVKPTSAVISQGAALGTIYQLLPTAPYEKGRMYRVNRRGQARPYCVRHDCEEYRGDALNAGDKIVKQELWASEGLDFDDTRFWVLYRSPKNVADLRTTDTFEYHFFNDQNKESEVQRVTISFRPRKKRIISCRYSNSVRNQNFDHQQETVVKCVLSNATNQLVMIPEFDKYRRHGAQVDFRLFQYRQDGNRVFNGARLANKTVDNVVGWWLDNQNTVILIPAARARRQMFQFRAMVYNISNDGHILPSTKEEVRVMVKRDNTPPEWSYEYITGRGNMDTQVGILSDIDITAIDADDDQLQFRLAEGVKKGTLYYEEMRYGYHTLSVIKTGALIRIPKGSYTRSDVRLHYKTDGAPGWKYPQYDNFILYADDGGGVLSPPLNFNITITGDLTSRSSATTTFVVSYGSVVVALLCAVTAFILILAVFLRRRNRQRYMAVPQDTEMH